MPQEYPPPTVRFHPHPAPTRPRPGTSPPPECHGAPASQAPVLIPKSPDQPVCDPNNEEPQDITTELLRASDTSYLAQALSSITHDVHSTLHPLPSPENLRCAACHIPIIISATDHFPILWRLAHCRHPVHLDCLAPLGCPYAINGVTQHPYYVHNPAATRIRRQRRHNPQFDHRPISRFEDAKRMRTWPCPQEGCGQVQFSVFSHGDWYSNVHGMTMDGHSISGPTHL